MFHRGGGTFGSAWGDGFAASVGGGTLRAAVGSSVGASGGGATLRSWGGGSALVSGLGSSLIPCRGSGAGFGAGATLVGASARVAKILARQRRVLACSTDDGGMGPSGAGWRRESVRSLVASITRSEEYGSAWSPGLETTP